VFASHKYPQLELICHQILTFAHVSPPTHVLFIEYAFLLNSSHPAPEQMHC